MRVGRRLCIKSVISISSYGLACQIEDLIYGTDINVRCGWSFVLMLTCRSGQFRGIGDSCLWLWELR